MNDDRKSALYHNLLIVSNELHNFILGLYVNVKGSSLIENFFFWLDILNLQYRLGANDEEWLLNLFSHIDDLVDSAISLYHQLLID